MGICYAGGEICDGCKVDRKQGRDEGVQRVYAGYGLGVRT